RTAVGDSPDFLSVPVLVQKQVGVKDRRPDAPEVADDVRGAAGQDGRRMPSDPGIESRPSACRGRRTETEQRQREARRERDRVGGALPGGGRLVEDEDEEDGRPGDGESGQAGEQVADVEELEVEPAGGAEHEELSGSGGGEAEAGGGGDARAL